MLRLKLSTLLLAFLTFVAPLTTYAQSRRGRGREAANRGALAARVRAEFLHAWRGYARHAWGHDELRPLSKRPHDWYGEPLYMTQVDSLDTLIMMGLDAEAARTREFVATHLSFDRDIYVQNFEITIRHLGGLLSCYQLTGDRRLLNLAEDLGTRLLPAFDSKTGIPYRFVNLKTGKLRGEVTNPAEAGTLLLEFGTLSKLTGREVFYEKAKRALVEVFRRRSKIGLVGSQINVETGEWVDKDSHISGGIDSYYEYQEKCWRLFYDEDCRTMALESFAAVNKYLADERGGALWYGHADMETGRRTSTTYGALDAFFPAVLVLSGDWSRAQRLQESSFRMWNVGGIEPEEFDYAAMKVKAPGYPLRPEIVESAYYLYRLQRDSRYQRMGEKMFHDFVKHCRTAEAYASLKSVLTKEKADEMQSFLFAETFKYFYLLFSHYAKLDLHHVVLNTEAHPLRRTW
ncbi:MAG TPA: glycoside hydrolase family 47 protein [Pyrinomonadaceae bacterium]|nr:glycoside hydrolase family 47 protein [Pyrinomonadaceae bacterium]